MKSFRFENIWMLSPKEKRARQVALHPMKNLIVGRNHTGKSSLVKTLYLTMGANPRGKLVQWDTSTISLVDFRVDEQRYRVLHQRGNRALFDSSGKILAATAKHSDWSKHFAAVVGFNLVLTNKDDASVVGDPSCFFIPFYIDQDGSWQSKWETFAGLQQYKSPIGSILEYFSGIKPPEFYSLKAKRDLMQGLLDELRKEQSFLSRARDRVGSSLSLSGPKLDPDNFEDEIRRLVIEVTELNRKQELLRDKSVREQENLSDIELQIRLAEDALGTYDGDAKFLRAEPRENLVCPTCRAEHSNSFLDLLTYAEDARVLRDLVVQLREDGRLMATQVKRTEAELRTLEENYQRISAILNTRRGDLRFQEVVDGAVAESAFRAFEDEATKLENDISTQAGIVSSLSDRMKILTDTRRTKSILDSFRQDYSMAVHELNLPSISTTKLRLTSRPDLSGSGGPRSTLAYYAALWRTCYGSSGAFEVPLVVDAPNQQGQDGINLPIVLNFISRCLPSQAQIIVCSEIDTEHEFHKRYVFDEPYHVLGKDEYNSIAEILRPFEDAMYAELSQEIPPSS